MKDISILSPTDVLALQVLNESPDTPAGSPVIDWLTLGRDYQAGERRCLASPEMVTALMEHIDQLEFANAILTKVAAARGHALNALVGRTGVDEVES